MVTPENSPVLRRLAAVLASDLVGYSRLMEQDEADTLDRLKRLRRELLDPLIAEHRGRVVKLMGDGALCEFASAIDAVACAVAIQRGMSARERNIAEENRLRLRIGVNLGEIIVDGEDIYGDGVNLAARLEGIAEPGGICVSGKVREELRNRLDVAFAFMGQQRVKNLSDPVDVWRVVLDGKGSSPRRRRMPAVPRPAIASLVVALLAAGGLAAWWLSSGPRPPESEQPSVAVLPLTNLSGDERLGRLADGMITDVITDLSGSRLLSVIAPGTTFAYRDQSRDARSIGRELGVAYVADGTLQGDGTRLRANVQLIDAESGVQLWSERYDRPVEDLFAVQDELTRRIANALRSGALDAALEDARGKSGNDLRAYDLLLLAREQRWLWNKEANSKAIELLQQALSVSPRMVAALVELAWLYRQQIDGGFAVSFDHAMARWLEAATAATTLDPAYARAQTALGVYYVYAGEHELAEPKFQRALELAPGDATILATVAEQLTVLGQPARAVELIETAVRLDPSSFYNDVQWQAYFFARRFQEAARAVEATPEPQRWPHLFAALSYAQLGRAAELREWRSRLLAAWPDYSYELGLSEGATFGPEAQAEAELWRESHVKAELPICATAEQAASSRMRRLAECDLQRQNTTSRS